MKTIPRLSIINYKQAPPYFIVSFNNRGSFLLWLYGSWIWSIYSDIQTSLGFYLYYNGKFKLYFYKLK
jgi:hypothetical protein